MKVDKVILDEKSEILKAIGHPIRLCIVKGLLDQGENNVTYMQGCLDVPQSTLSQHLGKLKSVGIIECERKGTEVYYKLTNKDVIKIIKALFD
jgi:ArsR family transcriptional regulator